MNNPNNEDIILSDFEINQIIREDNTNDVNRIKIEEEINKNINPNNNIIINNINNEIMKIINERFNIIQTEILKISNRLDILEKKYNDMDIKIKKIIDLNELNYEKEPINPFSTEMLNIYKNEINEDNNKMFESDQNQEIDMDESTINFKNNNKKTIKKRYYFVFKTTNKDRILQCTNEIKLDEDLDNYIIFREIEIKNGKIYYILIRFKIQKTMDINQYDDIEYIKIGTRVKNAIDRLKQYCIIIYNYKEGVGTEKNLKDVLKKF